MGTFMGEISFLFEGFLIIDFPVLDLSGKSAGN
jgi:hypothetical protein